MRGLVLAVVLAFGCASVRANEFCDTRGKVREHRAGIESIWKVFRDKKMDEVEKYFGGMVAEHEAGRLSDAHLGRAFAAFECTDASCEPLIEEWAKRYPRSAAAHLALAHHYAAVGFAARGTAFADETTDTQFVAMGEAFRKALAELDTADKYMTKHSLSASVRVWLGMASGGIRPRPTEAYRAAIRAFPETLQVRIRYIHASSPKWGGSVRQLESIIDDAKPLSPADRRYVEYLVLQELGNAFQCKACVGEADYKKAAEYYRKSVSLCPGLDRSLELMIYLQEKKKDYEALRLAATQLIERRPQDNWGYTMRGWALHAMHRYKEAFADFERAVQLGNSASNLNLAWYYETGNGVAKDHRKAIELALIADARHVDGAHAYAEGLQRGSAPEPAK